MISLTREVRFSLVPAADERPVANSWGGWPSATTIAPWLTLRCTLAGNVEPETGYLCNIKLVDDALRQRVVVPAGDRYREMTCESLLQFAFQQIDGVFPKHCQIDRLQLCVTPSLEYTLNTRNKSMIQLTQQFEFSASHRLHNPELSAEENRQLFGKCNNPHGHGHNYVVRVTVEGPLQENSTLVSLEELEQQVKQHVIDRLDHRNLNVEVPEFEDLNPSVENIAVVVWNLLQQPIQSLADGSVKLVQIRVYETPKTWADYFGDSRTS